jgi:hypothetical protein
MKEEAKQELAHRRRTRKMMRAVYILAALAVVLGAYLWAVNIPPPNGMYDPFAQCIASSGAKFYGAFWCPHCAQQKAEFGDAVKFLPYVECSNPDATAQTQVCIDKGIQEYPTWYFADGASSTGVQTLQQLSQKTNCPLPTSTP